MGENLTYRRSGKGYTELAAAFGATKKWAEEASLAHAAEELTFSVSATMKNPAGKQRPLFEARETDHTENGKAAKVPASQKSKACRNRHHDSCRADGCRCECGHKTKETHVNG